MTHWITNHRIATEGAGRQRGQSKDVAVEFGHLGAPFGRESPEDIDLSNLRPLHAVLPQQRAQSFYGWGLRESVHRNQRRKQAADDRSHKCEAIIAKQRPDAASQYERRVYLSPIARHRRFVSFSPLLPGLTK